MNILVTGGAGFIGSALIRYLITSTKHCVLNVDKLTYAGNLESLLEVSDSDRYQFSQADICDRTKMAEIFSGFQPDVVMHLAAESHVDRSIDSADDFIQTNIVGTYNLLEVARDYYSSLNEIRKEGFRFHHISTDEVYGDLAGTDALFTEETSYAPSSPYAASKASSDHLVRAWSRTYGLPVLITNCSNNYGPYQFPEKLIPLMIINAMEAKPLPVYGDGGQIRDWLFVDDHVKALMTVVEKGKLGETYNIGGFNEKTNLYVVETLCDILSELVPESSALETKHLGSYRDLITFVQDRPGHDVRYAIDAGKIAEALGWSPEETFETGLRKTVEWYLNNQSWWERVKDGSYAGERLGLSD